MEINFLSRVHNSILRDIYLLDDNIKEGNYVINTKEELLLVDKEQNGPETGKGMFKILTIREMQIEATLNFCLTSMKMAEINTVTAHVFEVKENSSTASVSPNLYSH